MADERTYLGYTANPAVANLDEWFARSGVKLPHGDPFVYESFTEAAEVDLVDHVGETGATWVLDGAQSDATPVVDSGVLQVTSMPWGTFVAKPSGTAPTADAFAALRTDFAWNMGATCSLTFGVRMKSDFSEPGYYVTAAIDAAGNATVALGGGDLARTVNVRRDQLQSARLELQVKGESIRVFLNDVLIISETDSAVPTTQRAVYLKVVVDEDGNANAEIDGPFEAGSL